MQFELIAPYQASPGQVAAVEKLVKNFVTKENKPFLGSLAAAKPLLWQT